MLPNISSAEPKKAQSIFWPRWKKTCPYGFYVRLTYAAALDCARRSKPITIAGIEELTGLSQKTIRNALDALAADGLCGMLRSGKSNLKIAKTDEGRKLVKRRRYMIWVALGEPSDPESLWYPKEGDSWLNRFAYDVVPVGSGLTPMQNVVAAKLRALLFKPLVSVCADMLGADAKVVSRIYKELAAMKTKGDIPIAPDEPQTQLREICPQTKGDMPATKGDMEETKGDMPTSISSNKEKYKSNIKSVDCFSAGAVEDKAAQLTAVYRKLLATELGLDSASVETVLRYWGRLLDKCKADGKPTESMILIGRVDGMLIGDYTPGYLRGKRARDYGAWIVGDLKERLGIAGRKPAPPRQPETPRPKERALGADDGCDYAWSAELRRLCQLPGGVELAKRLNRAFASSVKAYPSFKQTVGGVAEHRLPAIADWLNKYQYPLQPA